MIPLETIRELYDYNYWARDRQLEACAPLTPEQFLRPMGSSHSSVRDTLAHMVGSELYYLKRWRGLSAKEILSDFAATTTEERRKGWPERFSSVSDVRTSWAAVEQQVREYLAGLTEEMLPSLLTYVTNAGLVETYPLWMMMFTLLDHQTYHRGQVTTLLRQLGATPVPISFLAAHDKGFRKQ